ncbi:ABC transporter transmembrane domain-containing protein [Phytomonospora endophytica]|uniref:Putative ABC transport system ATP-binding protein n=1 Tax=Phytomonospora endophytica TaxID=714109 RepID=A0A841FLS9_9ACTN|nr:ABC transporter ATP-binding protein [Phytomonospora endophytica]MBB6034758.1 putative ABC transport system ATP-binding protein [Phytomonospora endophytica]GIG69039.1 multidrug ABC transporter ATP-binding protein [Phytomonospora endophytica]
MSHPRPSALRPLKPRLGKIALGSFALTSHQICEAMVPVAIGLTIDNGIVPRDPGGFATHIALLAGLFVVLSLSWRTGFTVLMRVSLEIGHDLRQTVTDRALRPGGLAGHRSAGESTVIATSDATRVSSLAWQVGVQVAALAAVATCTIALMRVSVVLGLIVLIASPLTLLFMHLLSRPLERRSEAEQEAAAAAGGLATEFVSGIRVVKGIGAETETARRYRLTSRDSLRAAVRAVRAKAAYDGVATTATAALTAGVALVAGLFALDDRIAIGQLVTVVGLAQFVQGPMTRLGAFGVELAQKRASVRRVDDYVNTPPAITPVEAPEPADKTSLLTVTRDDHGTWPDLRVGEGERVGVVFADQADAVSFVAALTRREALEGGRITVGGRDLATLTPDEARAGVHAQPRDARVLTDTVRDNLTLDGPLDEKALHAAAVEDVLAALPGGLDERLEGSGRTLSGGQRQRVLLARALHTPQPLLVLHDPTSALDAVTESHVAAGIAGLDGRGIVLVTTSPALLSSCDSVTARLDGEWTAATHAELFDSSASYRELVGA